MLKFALPKELIMSALSDLLSSPIQSIYFGFDDNGELYLDFEKTRNANEKHLEEQRKFEECQKSLFETPTIKNVRKERQDYFKERKSNDGNKQRNVKVNAYSTQQFNSRKPKKF